jgi:hypothetical protein
MAPIKYATFEQYIHSGSASVSSNILIEILVTVGIDKNGTPGPTTGYPG